MTLEYLLTSIVVILLPGTGVLYTLATGLNSGARASVLAAFGCTLGILPHIIASVAGLAALLHTSALAFEVIKYLGVAYLVYMAFSVLRDAESLQVTEEARPMRPGKIIATAILLNSLNPKLSLFFLAFPAAIRAGCHTVAHPVDAVACRRVHGAHLHHFRVLWRLCRRGTAPCHLPAGRNPLAAARFCRCLRVDGA